MFDGHIRIEEVARLTGLSRNTLYTYCRKGMLPPPRLRVGPVMLFHPEDIAVFIQYHKGNPKTRKGVSKVLLRKSLAYTAGAPRLRAFNNRDGLRGPSRGDMWCVPVRRTPGN